MAPQFFLVLGLILLHCTTSLASICRCIPGDSCWPSKSSWSQFNSSIGGNLIATVPIASSCHVDSFELYDAGKCVALQTRWSNTDTHWKSSSSIMAPFFANNSCDPFTSQKARCELGTYIQYAVKASCAADIQKTIAFVTKQNIRLVIRNTGHDYLGKSTGAGALGIWTHNMKKISFLNYNSAVYTGKAMKMGAGVQAFEAFAAARAQNLVIVGGTCQSVGLAGGYTQGGGHGLMSSKFGLGADQVLEWEVVTGTGKLLVASPSQNADLYWALSGGGGGTYGVVLSMTVRTYPELQTAGANLTFSNAGISQDTYYNAIERFVSVLPQLVDNNASSVWLNTNTTFFLFPTLAPGLTVRQLDRILAPLLAKLQNSNISFTYFSSSFSTFNDAYNAMNAPALVTEYQLGGRLIPRSVVELQPKALVRSMRTINEHGGVFSGVSVQVPKRTGFPANAVLPAWRKAILSATIGTPWSFTDFASNIPNQALMTNVLLPQLEKLTPGGGAYLNEGNFQQPDFQTVFYGSNYNTLKSIKDKYDPFQIFYALTGVGSDRWTQESNGKLCSSK